MKKIIYLLMTVGILFIVGCNNRNKTGVDIVVKGNNPIVTNSNSDGDAPNSKPWDGVTSEPIVPNKDGIYEINNAENLVWLAKEVNSGEHFDGKTFELNYNIDLNNKPFEPISFGTFWDTDNNPIEFRGIFDGNGKKIKNINIDKKDHSYVGFIGTLGENGIVKNLTIESGNINGNNNVGFVGYNEGTIENCHNYSSLTGNHSVGGIAGWNKLNVGKVLNSSSSYPGNLIGLNSGSPS